jgi:hypothetical protein
MTQREPSGEHVRYLRPPLSLTFTIFQEHKNRCRIQAAAFSGNHCFVVRELEAFYDQFGEIPVMIGSSMLSWTLWLVQFEAERRDQDRGSRRPTRAQFPQWPFPDHSLTEVEEVSF